jgi:hypothetical protein
LKFSIKLIVFLSAPRRFGKTISVSMFAAAMIFSCPNMELSIYSTCKRISQKLLRNIVKFLELIFLELNIMPYKFLRINQEEVHVAGNEGQVPPPPPPFATHELNGTMCTGGCARDQQLSLKDR